MVLKKAVEWDVIERMLCTIRLLPIAKPSTGFFDFDEYERLVEAVRRSRELSGGSDGTRTRGLRRDRPAF